MKIDCGPFVRSRYLDDKSLYQAMIEYIQYLEAHQIKPIDIKRIEDLKAKYEEWSNEHYLDRSDGWVHEAIDELVRLTAPSHSDTASD